ncbi:MAG: hypothetical protein MJ212_01905 [Alphaproteobacteria bacterium]|nr:hypothetical protein [Alphaproteobacteria bacterium]
MPFDSQGNFTRVHNWEEDRENDIEIISSRHDEEDDNFAQGLSQCMLRDGNSPMQNNLNMGNFQVNNVANGTALTDAVNKGQLSGVDNSCVHKTGNETISGNKTLTGSTSITTATMTTATVTTTLNIPGGKIWIA